MPEYSLSDLPENIRSRITVTDEPCQWISTFNLSKDGYPRLKGTGLYRVVYEILVGPIPSKFVVDHVLARGCIRHDCVWPGHLEAVTNRVNILRGTSFAAINARKERCGTCGREYDLFNTYIYKGRRDCRACIRRRVREYRKRLQERQADGFRRAA